MLALLPRVHAGWLVGNFVNMSGPGVPCALAQAELLVGTSQSFDGIAMSPVPALDVVFRRSAISRCGEGCADLKRLRPGLISAAGDTVAQQQKMPLVSQVPQLRDEKNIVGCQSITSTHACYKVSSLEMFIHFCKCPICDGNDTNR